MLSATVLAALIALTRWNRCWSDTSLSQALFAVSVDPFYSNDAIAVGPTISQSRNGALSWTSGLSSITDTMRSVQYVNRTAVSGGSLVHVSVDDGNTWSQAELPNLEVTCNSNMSYYVGVGMQGRYLAAAGSSLFVSTDQGTSWVEKGIFGNVCAVSASVNSSYLAILPCASTLVYISSDWGVTFVQHIVSAGPLLSISMSGDGRIMLAASETNVYLSSSFGSSWTSSFTYSGNSNASASSVSVDVSGEFFAVLYTDSLNTQTLTVSTDGGSHWTELESLSWAAQWSAVAAAGPAQLVLVAQQPLDKDINVAVSADGGNSWNYAGLSTSCGSAMHIPHLFANYLEDYGSSCENPCSSAVHVPTDYSVQYQGFCVTQQFNCHAVNMRLSPGLLLLGCALLLALHCLCWWTAPASKSTSQPPILVRIGVQLRSVLPSADLASKLLIVGRVTFVVLPIVRAVLLLVLVQTLVRLGFDAMRHRRDTRILPRPLLARTLLSTSSCNRDAERGSDAVSDASPAQMRADLLEPHASARPGVMAYALGAVLWAPDCALLVLWLGVLYVLYATQLWSLRHVRRFWFWVWRGGDEMMKPDRAGNESAEQSASPYAMQDDHSVLSHGSSGSQTGSTARHTRARPVTCEQTHYAHIIDLRWQHEQLCVCALLYALPMLLLQTFTLVKLPPAYPLQTALLALSMTCSALLVLAAVLRTALLVMLQLRPAPPPDRPKSKNKTPVSERGSSLGFGVYSRQSAHQIAGLVGSADDKHQELADSSSFSSSSKSLASADLA